MQPWSIPALCAAYNWPVAVAAGRGIIAVVELGGGWTASDMIAFIMALGQPLPSITDISVDGTYNTLQNPQSEADYEVALDIQMAAASYFVATGKPAVIRVYWSQNIATAVAAAAKDGCSVCSISWGADEAAWGKAQAEAMETAATAATAAGMIVLAASGDNDSSDGGPGAANVDCPASCPHVIGCGGTTKTSTAESVWNNDPGASNGEGTGGGYSMYFSPQPWQLGTPPAPKRVAGDKHPGTGRMVPDVSGCADPNTGVEIIVYGAQVVIGGTSVVAPLYAGLFAACGAKLGFVTPKLYQSRVAFNDITQGNNGDYSASVGPDPCSGIGSPVGIAVAGLL